MFFRSATGRRDLAIVAGSRAASFCGDFLASTALVVTFQARGAGGFTVAALLLASTLPMVLVAPLAGRLVDRVSSRVLLVGGGLVQAAVCTAVAFVSAPVLVIALMAVLGCTVAVTGPTLNALVPRIVERDSVPRAVGLQQMAGNLGMLAGPPLAGVLVGAFGARVPLLLDAATFLAMTVAGLALRTVRRGADRGGDGVRRAGGGWPVLRRDPLLVGFLVLLVAGVAVLTVDNVASVFLVRGVMHASPATFGLLEALWTAAMLGGTWLLGRRVASDRGLIRLTALEVAGAGMVQVGMAAAPGPAFLMPLFVLGGTGNAISNFALGVLVGRRVPDAYRGRVGAIIGGAVNAGIVTGYLLGGTLVGALPARAVFAVTGVAALVIAAVLTVPVLRAARRAPADPLAPDPVLPRAGEPAASLG